MAQIKLNATYGLTGNLPAVNGSAVTNLTSGNLSGNLPALNGSALTALNASNVGSGTLASARFSGGKIGAVNSRTRRGEYNISGNHGSGFVTMAEPYVTITPSSTSSRIKLTFQVLLSADGTGYKTTDLDIRRAISGGATTSRLAHTGDSSSIQGVAGRTFSGSSAVCQTPTALYTLMWIDNPSTTSAVEYKLVSQATDNSANGNLYIFNNGQTCTFVGEEILP